MPNEVQRATSSQTGHVRNPRSERGATAVEYALMVGFIAAVAASGAGMLGTGVTGLFLKGLAGFP